MPIFIPGDAPAIGTTIAPKSPEPMTICTIGAADNGEECRSCGWPSGPGHGKKEPK